jgi:hypothetical protein
MTAYMLVRDDGYFAVTNENGEFEIPNVPAGVKITFRFWQEKLKFLGKVKVNGADAALKQGRLIETFQKDETKTVEIQIEAAAFDR